jgi:hypothetical protein
MRILCIPDLHEPYAHPAAADFIRRQLRDFTPDAVVLLGDEIDSHAMSRWPADPDILNAGAEITLARHRLQALARMLKPYPRVYVCASNHAARVATKAVRAGLSRQVLRGVPELFAWPANWKLARRWVLDGILFKHGEEIAATAAALERSMYLYGTALVVGHCHSRAEIIWTKANGRRRFAMRCGCLLNPLSRAFGYAAESCFQPVLGCGRITHGVPGFIPLS